MGPPRVKRRTYPKAAQRKASGAAHGRPMRDYDKPHQSYERPISMNGRTGFGSIRGVIIRRGRSKRI